MPRYVYQCSQCNKNFEVEKSMSQASRDEQCPQCHTTGSRVFTAPGITGFASGSDSYSGSESGGCTSCCPGGSCGIG